ncbi:hypothetical protein QQZ08_006153 [Neonectria magnoliae]|uniref:Uncharacterized protein n=1 Tax=Neonectria magnoliae TaxID=2732573 RepID=A0ABR1I2V4_9HYPO
MDTSRKGAFQFVQLSHPQDAASWKRRVRSHAAKNAHVRQKRVVQYQNDKAKEALGRPEHPQQPKTAVTGSIITALGAGRTDPFDSFVRKVTKMENFLLDHFVRHVVLHVVTCYPLRTLSDEVDFRQGMATHWVRLAATDTGMLATLFLASCRTLSNYQHEEFYATLALQYKGQCITTLKSALEHEGDMISDATITKTLALASEATLAGDLAAEQQHTQAAEKMVSMRGGIETLGMSGFLKKLIIWFIRRPSQGGNGKRLLTPTCMPSASMTIVGFVGVARPEQ